MKHIWTINNSKKKKSLFKRVLLAALFLIPSLLFGETRQEKRSMVILSGGVNTQLDADSLLTEPVGAVSMRRLHFFNPSSGDGFYWYLFGFNFRGTGAGEITSDIHLGGIGRRFEFSQKVNMNLGISTVTSYNMFGTHEKSEDNIGLSPLLSAGISLGKRAETGIMLEPVFKLYTDENDNPYLKSELRVAAYLSLKTFTLKQISGWPESSDAPK